MPLWVLVVVATGPRARDVLSKSYLHKVRRFVPRRREA